MAVKSAAKARTTAAPGAPDERGHFGPYGGRFVAETLISALEELEANYRRLAKNAAFKKELQADLADFAGRPSPLYHARRWSDELGGAQIFLKREDLNHTGAHKINNTIGQALLARHSGKQRIIAETGAGQHGVAVAATAARMGMSCCVYMGSEDMRRQAPNVERMRLLGAQVAAVEAGSRTLKDALNEALRDWIAHVEDSFYIIGSVTGPHPYPTLVRDFQSVIGREVRSQCKNVLGRLPDLLVACVGGGSNAMGLFHPFLQDSQVRMIAVEAAGRGLPSGEHAASLQAGRRGILHGTCSYLLADSGGQVLPTHSISAGLDYPGVGPELAQLKDQGRLECHSADDDEAVAAFRRLARREGILPALESAHALAWVEKTAPGMERDQLIVLNLSGRGDKDLHTVLEYEKRNRNSP